MTVKIKSSSLGSNRNKMRAFLVFMVILLFGVPVQAQSSESVSSQMVVSKKYAPGLLEDYRLNAQNKITDLFNYFQILTDASLTDAYKKEVVNNIKAIFKNQNPPVIDLTSEAETIVLLDDLISKLLVSTPISFKVADAWQNDSESNLSWQTSYTVLRTKSGITENIKISQTIYLFEERKTFGTISKKVTVTFLGKME